MSAATAPALSLDLTDPTIYTNAAKPCDIIMKGGITSGVVYPLAVCEIARTYHFKSIGGTSAGAIAAAVTAAAEYGRNTPEGGFAKIATLPDWLKVDDNLFHLFQPQDTTTPLFRLVTAAIGPEQGRTGRLFVAFVRNLWLGLLIGLLPGVVLAVAALLSDPIDDTWGLVAAAILGVLGLLVGFAVHAYLFARRTLAAIPGNFYGICNGFQDDEQQRPQALTGWLTDYIDSVAGVTGRGHSLTFGDLWGDDHTPGNRTINLEVMSTNLTMGRPFRLPFDNDRFYFDPREFRKLFPKQVVDWMVANTRDKDDPAKRDRFLPLLPLPAAADMPVVVAARMSLSFPIMISAIPLYAIDFSGKQPESTGPERCWFSDGGIASNFPIHFFDNPLPRWPTFAINLRGFHPDHPPTPDQIENVYLVQSNTGGTQEWWDRFESVSGFLGALRNSMQNWLDNLQTYQPGNRDRIAHISLDEREGGMNLKMPGDTLDLLRERGQWAGIKLRDRFANPPQNPRDLSWDNHRWVRYRTAMAATEQFLERLSAGYNSVMPGERTYPELINRQKGEAPTSYAFEGTEGARAQAATDALVTVWEQQSLPFDDGAPSPRPEIRATPRF